jgi:hypothetical protein
MQSLKQFFRTWRRAIRWRLRAMPLRWRNPEAYSFFAGLMDHGYHPDGHIDVVPEYRLIYIGNPKVASSTIKKSLSGLTGERPDSLSDVHKRGRSGLLSPMETGIEEFWRLATAPDTLRFSFVRNPYDRLISCWADKFQGRPLVGGDPFVNVYLDFRRNHDRSLPHGRNAVLPFEAFVELATVTCDKRADPHWALQDDLLTMPGIALDFVGNVENFAADFERVIAHVGDRATLAISPRMNISTRSKCRDYFDDTLARRVYRAYERDFDRFGYPAALPE